MNPDTDRSTAQPVFAREGQGRLLFMVVTHVPALCWLASFVLDIIYFTGGSPLVASASYYLLKIGVILGTFAVIAEVAGLLYIAPRTPARKLASQHLIWNLAALFLYYANYALRNAAQQTIPDISATMFVLSCLGLTLLGVSTLFGMKLWFELKLYGWRGERRVPMLREVSSRDRRAA